MRRLIFVVLLTCCGSAMALPWSKDMVDQPSVKPQETTVRQASDSVPVSRKERIPVPTDVADVVRSRLEASRKLVSPVPTSPESVARGKEIYDVHCTVCHGSEGKGDGTVGKKFVPPPMDLSTDYVQLQGEGQIYYTITHGGLAMPFYRDAIKEIDRWHVINYIKSEFNTQ
ncbi:MAG: cytochrome c [Gammaproteobacteria bacterium]|nr:cytochrome c [Gammaproteobacteria bacterium]